MPSFDFYRKLAVLSLEKTNFTVDFCFSGLSTDNWVSKNHFRSLELKGVPRSLVSFGTYRICTNVRLWPAYLIAYKIKSEIKRDFHVLLVQDSRFWMFVNIVQLLCRLIEKTWWLWLHYHWSKFFEFLEKWHFSKLKTVCYRKQIVDFHLARTKSSSIKYSEFNYLVWPVIFATSLYQL